MTINDQGQQVLQGDGSWGWNATIDGDDIVVRGGFATWFGGDSDPQDNGQTASGIVTKHNPTVQGVALPMHGKGESATEGSPLPPMPYLTTHVNLWFPTTGVHLSGENAQRVIDLGPGKQATKNPAIPHTIDLTLATFRLSGVAPSHGIVRCDYRILGGATFIAPTS